TRSFTAIVEPLRIELPFLEDQFQEDPPQESQMADNQTMAELLQAPTEGYEDAIVIPEITTSRSIGFDNPVRGYESECEHPVNGQFVLRIVGERKPRKGQNQIKTEQKREAWRVQEKFKAVAVGRGRKTEQNAKRMAEKANTVKSYSSFKKKKEKKMLKSAISPKFNHKGQICQISKLVTQGTNFEIGVITLRGYSC
nr:hypothetical protein [Tanacetum cinerariifolium]